jgi:hypothetical protein
VQGQIPPVPEEQANALRCLLELVLRSPGQYTADCPCRTPPRDGAAGSGARATLDESVNGGHIGAPR